jgi:hypothetical protein
MQTTKGMFYPEPYALPGSVIAHHIISASETSLPFWTENARDLFVTALACEFLQTNMTGTNNDLFFISRRGVVNSPAITITIVVAGANTVASVVVTGTAIVINSATDGASAATSTANAIIALVQASAAATALVVVGLKTGNNGTGVVTALTSTALAGWAGDETLDVAVVTAIDETSLTTPTGHYDAADNGTLTQLTAAGHAGRSASGLGTSARYVVTLGGTTPTVAYAILALSRPSV